MFPAESAHTYCNNVSKSTNDATMTPLAINQPQQIYSMSSTGSNEEEGNEETSTQATSKINLQVYPNKIRKINIAKQYKQSAEKMPTQEY